VLAKTEGRQAKGASHPAQEAGPVLGKLHAMHLHPPSRDQLLPRIGTARKDAGRAARFVTLRIPPEGVRLISPPLLSTSPLYRKT